MTVQRLHPGLSFPFRCLRNQPRLFKQEQEIPVRSQFPASLCQGWLLQRFVIYNMTLHGQGPAKSDEPQGQGQSVVRLALLRVQLFPCSLSLVLETE